MADKIATDFISKIKAKSGQAIDWFKSIVKKTQQAAFPAATGRRDIMTDRNIGVSTGKPTIGQLYLFQYRQLKIVILLLVLSQYISSQQVDLHL